MLRTDGVLVQMDRVEGLQMVTYNDNCFNKGVSCGECEMEVETVRITNRTNKITNLSYYHH